MLKKLITLLIIFILLSIHSNIQSQAICIGEGTVPMGSTSGPFNTYWYGNRTQLLYLANEVGYSRHIWKIAFKISVASGHTMNGFNIRMQHTTNTTLTGFIDSGWTTVYSGTYNVPGTGWQYIDLQQPYFHYNGTSNLLIEICFGNSSYSSATTVLGTTMPGMEYTEYHDLTTACTYAGFTNGIQQTARANICIYGDPVSGFNQNIGSLPEKYSLSQNYPNPFNPNTRINFNIPKNVFVSLKIFDVLGSEVQTLVNEVKSAGSYSVDFNASGLPSGVYFYRLETSDFVQTNKMILLK